MEQPQSQDDGTPYIARFESLEQDAVRLSLPNGEVLEATGAIKGPEGDTFEGITADGEKVLVLFTKTADGKMEPSTVWVNDAVVFELPTIH